MPKLGESVNKMRKIMPLERSESNNMLKLIKLKKKADEFERSRVNLTQIFEPHDRMSLNQSVTRFQNNSTISPKMNGTQGRNFLNLPLL